MARLTPDPSFYPTPRMATEAPPETLAYVTMLNPSFEGAPDAIGVVEVERHDFACVAVVVERHTDPATGKGTHGEDIAADMDLVHFFNLGQGNQKTLKK